MTTKDIDFDQARREIDNLATEIAKGGSRGRLQFVKILFAGRLGLIDHQALSAYAQYVYPWADHDLDGEETRQKRRDLMSAYIDCTFDVYKNRRGIYPVVVGELFTMLKEMDK